MNASRTALLLLAASAAASLPAGAAAQSGDVAFNGAVLPSCTVIAGTPGTIGPNPTGDVLSSANGLPGTAAVTATGAGYQVTVDPPLGFDLSPTGGADNATFSASYEATGATVAASVTAGSLIGLGIGATTITVDSEARRSVGAFPAGTYRMVTTVRCIQP